MAATFWENGCSLTLRSAVAVFRGGDGLSFICEQTNLGKVDHADQYC